MNNIQAKFYMPKADSSVLRAAIAIFRHAAIDAPTLSRWLVREFQSRLAVRDRGVEEEPLLIPFCDWSNAELAESLVVLDAMTKTAPQYRLGELCDELQTVLIAVVARRLKKSTVTVGA